MGSGPYERLTEGQRDCLRRVLLHMSSKDIARDLDISRHTVDQRLKIAMRTLGASSRVEAARIFARLEGGDGAYQAFVHQSPDIAGAPGPGTIAGSEDEVQTGGGGYLREAEGERSAAAAALPKPRQLPPFPLPIGGTKPSEIRPMQRLAWIAAITVAIILTFAMLITALEGLSRVARAFT